MLVCASELDPPPDELDEPTHQSSPLVGSWNGVVVVDVLTGRSETSVTQVGPRALQVSITLARADGDTNAAVERVVESWLNLPQGSAEVIIGQCARRKRVRLTAEGLWEPLISTETGNR